MNSIRLKNQPKKMTGSSENEKKTDTSRIVDIEDDVGAYYIVFIG